MFLILGFAEDTIRLVPDGTLFVHIGIILLMIFILNATLFKPINRILDGRELNTQGGSSKAQEIMRKVEQGITQYEQGLREARVQSYQLMEQQRAEVMRERQEKLGAVREDVTRLLDTEKQSIQTQTDQARATLTQDARRTAAEISARILHRPIAESSTTEALV